MSEIDEIRERWEKTTKGQWFYNGYRGIWATEITGPSEFGKEPDPEDGIRMEQIVSVYDPEHMAGGGDIARYHETAANAEFMAEAHQDIPALLAHIDKLSQERDAAISENRKNREWGNVLKLDNARLREALEQIDDEIASANDPVVSLRIIDDLATAALQPEEE